MSESKNQICSFCNKNSSIMSKMDDEIRYLDPNTAYGKSFRAHNHENVQVDINDSNYPDARPGDSTSAGFWFDYCSKCGRKLV